MANSAASDGINQRSQGANSGLFFLRKLLTKIDPSNSTKQQPTAWNVGCNAVQAVTSRPALSITDLLSHAQMTTLVSAYFEKVDPCYGFVERSTITRQINSKWLGQFGSEHYEATLCGIAALGSYFSKEFAVSAEPQLVQLAKSLLESQDLSRTADINTVNAWICRVIYLRLTSTPFPAWLASCTAMHMLEAAGLHANVRLDEDVLSRSLTAASPQILGRAFGVAQHLNTWISYDLGFTPISLESPPIVSTSSTTANYTEKLLELLPYSLSMRNAAKQDDDHLQSMLATIVAKTDPQPPLIMAQCNLLLCILRQLCARNALRTVGDRDSDLALRFLAKGLQAARQMVKDDCPWHHLANVPFQTLCMLLAIDTPASLKMIEDAMQTLYCVAQAYRTVVLEQAYTTASLVLSLHQKRRLDDAQIIERVLSNLANTQMTPHDSQPTELDWPMPDATELVWLKDLMYDFPSLHNFEVEDVLENDPSKTFG